MVPSTPTALKKAAVYPRMRKEPHEKKCIHKQNFKLNIYRVFLIHDKDFIKVYWITGKHLKLFFFWWKGKFACFSFEKNLFYFILEYSWLTILWQFLVSSEGTQPYRYIFPFSPNSPPTQAATNPEQSSLCCTIGPCWLSILNRVVCTWPPQIP